jgi:NDP-sugar pyrophosphorylase family protein
VLTAGLGTRLQPLTSWRAKPALPVAGTTLIERILKGLASQGVRDLVLNLHHLPETITMVLGDGSAHGVRIRYSYEQPLLGSGGGPRRAFDLVEDDRLLLVNGDTLARVDLRRWRRAIPRHVRWSRWP